MKVVISGFEIEVEPTENPFGDDYKYRKVIKETEKAYLVEQPICSRYTTKINYKWVGKSACKVDKNGDVFVPIWLV